MDAAETSLEFARPDAAAWAIAAVACCGLLAWLVAWRRRAVAALADAPVLARIAPGLARARGTLRAALLAGAVILLVPALMDPRAGAARDTVTQTSVDIMVVVDVSRSMLAEDAQPNRLARAKQFAGDLVEGIGSDRVGLIEFAGVPSLRCPLTFNHRAFRTQLEALSPQSTVRGGSMLGDAIRLAVESLDGDGGGKAIVILSDGEDMESEPVEAAAVAAKEHGIRVATIGIGDAKDGARIPVYENGLRRFIVHDGQEVWSKMDPRLLREVADAGDGPFVEAGVDQADIRQLARILSQGLERATRERADVSTRLPLFQIFVGLALALLSIECLLYPRAPRERPA
ncbi:MAG: hypothetical protein RL325_1728 [Planctomycetota bacterium]|jgi:Ca-activated chloride channel family protein